MESCRPVLVTASLIIATTFGLYYYFWRTRDSKKKMIRKMMVPRIQNHKELKEMPWECVGKVTKIYVYPVKSCKGVCVESAMAHYRGLVHGTARDRSFIITSEKGTMITGRMVPSSVLIQSTFENNILTLNFPGMKQLQVDINQVAKTRKLFKTVIWGQEVSGLDCGSDVSLWLEKVLSRKCKLLYQADLPPMRVSEHPLAEQSPLLRDDDHSLYADFSGYMLMTQESIADLQNRVNCKIAAEDFRPNILLEGVNKPYDEDEWQYIKIGDAVFRNVVPCLRCIFTTVSAATGKKNPDKEPLRTLNTYRCQEGIDSPFFGINLGLDLIGKVSVGDEVFITRAK